MTCFNLFSGRGFQEERGIEKQFNNNIQGNKINKSILKLARWGTGMITESWRQRINNMVKSINDFDMLF